MYFRVLGLKKKHSLVACRSPPSVRNDVPVHLSFQDWTPQDALPVFEDEVSDFDLDPPDPFLEEDGL